MTKKKEGARPKASMTKPKAPVKRRGWLVCDDCKTTVEAYENAVDGYPQHRCGYVIRPFARWVAEDPKAQSKQIVLGYWNIDKSPLEGL